MSWKNKPTDFINTVEADLVKQQKRIVVEAIQGVVMASPVDSGAYRGNHRVSVGSVDTSYDLAALDKGGSGTVSKGLANLVALKPFQTVYISNSLPYAMKLEYGWSDQAKQGVYRITLNYISQKYGG